MDLDKSTKAPYCAFTLTFIGFMEEEDDEDGLLVREELELGL